MITIHNLEVRFDVEGNDEESTFARLFDQHIQRWANRYEQQQAARRFAEREQNLGDRMIWERS